MKYIKKKKGMKVCYKVRAGAHQLNKETAQIYGTKIADMMRKKDDKITAMDLLNEAEKANSVFHNHFIWDDTKAAVEYRLQQARYILRVIVQEVIIDGEPEEVRAFLTVKNPKKNVNTSEHIYVTLDTAMTNESYRQELLSKIITQLEHLTTLMKMFKETKK